MIHVGRLRSLVVNDTVMNVQGEGGVNEERKKIAFIPG